MLRLVLVVLRELAGHLLHPVEVIFCLAPESLLVRFEEEQEVTAVQHLRVVHLREEEVLDGLLVEVSVADLVDHLLRVLVLQGLREPLEVLPSALDYPVLGLCLEHELSVASEDGLLDVVHLDERDCGLLLH